MVSRLESVVKEMKSPPGLAAVLVGENEASKLYVYLKRRTAERIGIAFFEYRFPADAPEGDVLECVASLNNDDAVDGILVQLPLPEHIGKRTILDSISPAKDVDGLCEMDASESPDPACGFLCPFPKSILMLLESSQSDMAGKKGVVLANSQGFGRSMSNLMRSKGIETEVILNRDIDRKSEIVRSADFVVTALGSPGRVDASLIGEGAVVIDGGIDKVEGKIRGDVDRESVELKASCLSPVPGGVGPLTIACLMDNVVIAAKRNGK